METGTRTSRSRVVRRTASPGSATSGAAPSVLGSSWPGTRQRPARSTPADIDGDEDLDVLATASDDDRVLLFKNLGAGVFTPGQELDDDAGAPSDVTTGDVDEDGDLDVVVASYDDDRVLWYENYGGGLYGPSQVVGSNVDKAASVAVADLDGDGDLDVAAASSAEGGGVRWFKNLGYGSFASGGNVANYDGGANWVEAADLDEDGAVDLVVSSYDQASHVWYRNAGNGSAWSPEVLTAYAAGASAPSPVTSMATATWDVLTTSSGANKVPGSSASGADRSHRGPLARAVPRGLPVEGAGAPVALAERGPLQGLWGPAEPRAGPGPVAGRGSTCCVGDPPRVRWGTPAARQRSLMETWLAGSSQNPGHLAYPNCNFLPGRPSPAPPGPGHPAHEPHHRSRRGPGRAVPCPSLPSPRPTASAPRTSSILLRTAPRAS